MKEYTSYYIAMRDIKAQQNSIPVIEHEYFQIVIKGMANNHCSFSAIRAHERLCMLQREFYVGKVTLLDAVDGRAHVHDGSPGIHQGVHNHLSSEQCKMKLNTKASYYLNILHRYLIFCDHAEAHEVHRIALIRHGIHGHTHFAINRHHRMIRRVSERTK
jgi:hypothetical protein